jgi:hypothetical protein
MRARELHQRRREDASADDLNGALEPVHASRPAQALRLHHRCELGLRLGSFSGGI